MSQNPPPHIDRPTTRPVMAVAMLVIVAVIMGMVVIVGMVVIMRVVVVMVVIMCVVVVMMSLAGASPVRALTAPAVTTHQSVRCPGTGSCPERLGSR